MQRVLLTVISLGLSLLSSTLLLTAMCTNNWIVRPTVWGNYYEGLQKFCLLSKCESLQRDWVYNVFVLGFLSLGAVAGFTCNILSLLVQICGKKELMHRFVRNAGLLSVMGTMIGMSVYTGRYTRNFPLAFHGWSFFLAWCCFPLSLAAATIAMVNEIFHKREEAS
ncbi:epithelial membrane protein 1-like isoform X1 [Rhineura floridana]|uniref:epithelial membrane protein 1-like isoform X1 n=1 Tax=Rhineura floridana TaxID=261503 RepID=UPI002AC7F2E2|nr:epithelial membrane protein 1-like isoform X1 [Rhineura floridana]